MAVDRPRKCIQCGEPITVSRYNSRVRLYCSDTCRKRAQRQREKPDIVYKASVDGLFISSNSWKYCACGCGEVVKTGRKVYASAACKQRAYRARVAETEDNAGTDYYYDPHIEHVITRECDKCGSLMKRLGIDQVWDDDADGFTMVSVWECQRCGRVVELPA